MEIDVKNNKTTTFKDVNIGESFRYSSTPLIRMSAILKYNCVNLANGCPLTLSDADIVSEINEFKIIKK